jgi:hypothetical protein
MKKLKRLIIVILSEILNTEKSNTATNLQNILLHKNHGTTNRVLKTVPRSILCPKILVNSASIRRVIGNIEIEKNVYWSRKMVE